MNTPPPTDEVIRSHVANTEHELTRRIGRTRVLASAAVAAGVLAVALITMNALGPGANVSPPTDIAEGFSAPVGTIDALGETEVDYEAARTTEELASRSDLVVQGTIAGVEEGPTVRQPAGGGSASRLGTVILAVAVDETTLGELPDESDGVIYLRVINSSGEFGHLDVAFPVGLPVVAYVVEIPELGREEEPDAYEILSPDAGRPAGQPLWVPNIQGLITQGVDGELVWPLLHESEKGNLNETLPGGALIVQ